MNKLYKYKFIPQNHIVENTLLGIMIINPNIFDTVKRNINKDFFFLEVNQIIYTHLIEISNKHSDNLIELIYKIYNKGLLSKIGGISKITQIIKQGQIIISSSKTQEYITTLASILYDNYLKRLIIQCGYNIIHLGYLNKIEKHNIYTKILSQIHYLETEISKRNNEKIVNIKDLISHQLIESKYYHLFINSNTHYETLKSGFRDLDYIIESLQKGNLIIIAGRPSIGKTSFVINLAYNIFFEQKNSILIFSLEMSNNELFNKIISIASKTIVSTKTIKYLDQQQWKKISDICKTLINQNIYINDKNNIDIQYITETAKSIKKKLKILISL